MSGFDSVPEQTAFYFAVYKDLSESPLPVTYRIYLACCLLQLVRPIGLSTFIGLSYYSVETSCSRHIGLFLR